MAPLKLTHPHGKVMGSDRLHEGLQMDLITSRRASGVWCFWHVLASAIRTTHSLANRTHMQMLIADLPPSIIIPSFFCPWAKGPRYLPSGNKAKRQQGIHHSRLIGFRTLVLRLLCFVTPWILILESKYPAADYKRFKATPFVIPNSSCIMCSRKKWKCQRSVSLLLLNLLCLYQTSSLASY
jgi:hypothetical protein